VDIRQFGPNMDSVDKITEDVLQTWLDTHREVKKDALSASQVQSIVTKNLRINMLEKDVEQRIIMLFVDYSSLMRTNGLSWVIEQNPKVSIGHIVGVLKPIALQKRLHDDLEFSHAELKKDFLGFLEHVIARAKIYPDYTETDPPSNSRQFLDSSGNKGLRSDGRRRNNSSSPTNSDAQAVSKAS
jgi:hypothetical protein